MPLDVDELGEAEEQAEEEIDVREEDDEVPEDSVEKIVAALLMKRPRTPAKAMVERTQTAPRRMPSPWGPLGWREAIVQVHESEEHRRRRAGAARRIVSLRNSPAPDPYASPRKRVTSDAASMATTARSATSSIAKPRRLSRTRPPFPVEAQTTRRPRWIVTIEGGPREEAQGADRGREKPERPAEQGLDRASGDHRPEKGGYGALGFREDHRPGSHEGRCETEREEEGRHGRQEEGIGSGRRTIWRADALRSARIKRPRAARSPSRSAKPLHRWYCRVKGAPAQGLVVPSRLPEPRTGANGNGQTY